MSRIVRDIKYRPVRIMRTIRGCCTSRIVRDIKYRPRRTQHATIVMETFQFIYSHTFLKKHFFNNFL